MKELFVLAIISVGSWIYEGDKVPSVYVEAKELGVFTSAGDCTEALGKHQGKALLGANQTIQCLPAPMPKQQARYR